MWGAVNAAAPGVQVVPAVPVTSLGGGGGGIEGDVGASRSAYASTSSMRDTRSILISLRTSSGMSSMSFALRSGSSTWVMPARCAARTFSFTPPMGSTTPRRVISPVIAMSLRTGRPVSSEVTAVTMVTPAEGPSFGVPPCGTCTCMSLFCRNSGSIPRRWALVRTQEMAAATDSFITFPSWPVIDISPLPAKRWAST